MVRLERNPAKPAPGLDPGVGTGSPQDCANRDHLKVAEWLKAHQRAKARVF